MTKGKLLPLILTAIVLTACSSSESATTTVVSSTTTVATNADANLAKTRFIAEVWADNWFSLYINGVLVGEDSVPITTERSFNSETISFQASYPFTIAMVTKDFKQNDTGLEYINTDRQQMGDGGFIAQFTDTTTGKVIAYTSAKWRGLTVHQAPLNVSCEKSLDPETDCKSRILSEPENWTSQIFNDSEWPHATTYSEDEIGVKDGYNDIHWSPSAALIWTSDLKMDNTILWRYSVTK